MYDDINILEYIYQTARNSQEIIARVIILNIDNKKYNEILKSEFYNNKKIANSVSTMLKRRKKEVKEIGVFSQMIAYMSIKINSSDDDTDGDIINIVIQNIKQVIDELSVKLRENKIKNKCIRNLIERYILFEKECLEKINAIMNNE